MKTAAEHALDKIDMINEHHAQMSAVLQTHNAAVTEHGCLYFLGRKVLLTFADTGLPTHEDPQIRELFPREKVA